MKKKLTQKQAYELATREQFIEPIKLGPWTSYSLLHDPIHISFVLSRYKFVARMLTGKKTVLEIGCGDAPGTPIVAEFVEKVVAIDAESRLIEGNRERLAKVKNIEFRTADFCVDEFAETFDAVYSIDVIEHLDEHMNDPFMARTLACLKDDGICMVGTPNKTSEKHFSKRGKIEHINLKTHESLKEQMEKYFKHVFMFSMSDEVVHTGFPPMAQYLWALGVGKKDVWQK